MSADNQDLANRLLMQLSQTGGAAQPSFAGISAPQNPGNMLSALAQINQRNDASNANAPTPGQYGYLHDAGTGKSLFNVGQQAGNFAQSGSTATPTAPDAVGPNPYAGIGQAITKAKAISQQSLAQGDDPLTAQQKGLQFLAQVGVPGASDKLIELQSTDLKNKGEVASAAKNNAQADNYGAETANRNATQQLNTSKDTWNTISETPGTIIQKNGLGEVRVQQKQPASAQAAAAITPDAMGAMLQSYKTTGTVPAGLSRSPAAMGMFWDAVAKDSAATGDTAAAVQANRASLKANGQALDQTQKQLSQTQSYFATMDKNIAAASALAKNIDFGDATALNKAFAAWDKGTSDPQYAKYNVFFDSVANEYAKIKSGALGNAPVSDSARHEAMSVLMPTMSSQGVQAAFDAVKQEGQNRLDSLATQRDMLTAKISGKAPPAAPAAPTAPTAPAPPAAGSGQLTYDPASGTFK